MNLPELLRWQYAGYAKFHRSRDNLLIHIVVVPFFLIGAVSLVLSIARQSWLAAAISLATMVVSLALQGRGHGLEQYPPEPFTGKCNAVARIFLEQFITFPRFVLSGAWWRALHTSARERAES
jgi:phage terminase small subunit